MKTMQSVLTALAVVAMLSTTGLSQRTYRVPSTIVHNLTQAQCEALGGEWHCFPGGRCSCF